MFKLKVAEWISIIFISHLMTHTGPGIRHNRWWNFCAMLGNSPGTSATNTSTSFYINQSVESCVYCNTIKENPQSVLLEWLMMWSISHLIFLILTNLPISLNSCYNEVSEVYWKLNPGSLIRQSWDGYRNEILPFKSVLTKQIFIILWNDPFYGRTQKNAQNLLQINVL